MLARFKLNIVDKSYRMLFVLGLLICNLADPQDLCAKEASLQQDATDFTSVAKKAIPAVVSIKVKLHPSQQKMFTFKGDSSDSQDFNDFFGDDFWGRFFGVPRRSQDQNPKPQQIAQASGFIISEDGYILTNSHVVSDTDSITVQLNDGREFGGKIIGQDPNTDIAVIKIDTSNLPFLKLGNSDELEVGQWAVAIGNPLGLQASLTVGVISAKGRSDLDITHFEDFIQTDAAINRGNSGGPLLSLKGDVIGINTAIASSTGGYMGIGFAIPSNMAQHIMEQLISNGSVTRGYIGVILQRIDNDLAKAFNLDKVEGGLIAEVSKNSPAEKAGLKQGDIILSYNNHPVESIAALRNAVSLTSPGKPINLSIKRDQKVFDINIEVATFPGSEIAQAPHINKLGFEVEELSHDIAQNLGYLNEKGVIVNKVQPNSPAAFAGIKRGSLIVAINQEKVSSLVDFNAALEKAGKEQPILFLIKQGDVMRFVALKVD